MTREEPLDEEISVKHRPPSSATSYPSFDSKDGPIEYVVFPLGVNPLFSLVLLHYLSFLSHYFVSLSIFSSNV